MEFGYWDKKQIYDLARLSYLAVKSSNVIDQYDMIHTENFMLIDTKKQIRGFMMVQIQNQLKSSRRYKSVKRKYL